MNQAIEDGTDVLNYSISGADRPWTDPVDLAFLDAYAAGIFVSASGGNDGPGPSTVAKTGPWNASVAASTHNRVIANAVDVIDPVPSPELVGMAAVPGTGPDITEDIVAEALWAGDVDSDNVRGCDPFPTGSFVDGTALIQRGDCTFETKVTNAFNAGAIAVIIYNNVGGPPIVMGSLEPTVIPAVFIDKGDGDALADFITTEGPVEARINEDLSVIVNDAWQDIMAGFSSRGPSQWDLLKPDYAAPGVNILAAGFDGPDHYVFLQGTSMSSPHGAGAAALLVQRYPDWSPAEVKSALAMTAWQDMVKEDGVTLTDYFDMGSGRIDLTQGALVGLVMDETVENYAAADPDDGGEPRTLNEPSMVDHECVNECSWTRTVRSVLDEPATYNVTTEAPAGMVIAVTPITFTIAADAEQELDIHVDVDLDVLPAGDWAFAQVHLQADDDLTHRLPIAIVPYAEAPIMTLDPEEVSSTQGPDQVETEILTIGNEGGIDLEWEVVDTDVLYDNGPLITGFRDGFGGADTSALQTTLGMNTYGAAVYPSADDYFRIADGFEVATPGGWSIENVVFYAYQIGSGTESTFSTVNYRIWDGSPDDPDSEVIYGDTVTNRIDDTGWTGVYRVLDTNLTDTARPIMAIVGKADDLHLDPGTYWIDWQLDGTLASGPWQPPITILR